MGKKRLAKTIGIVELLKIFQTEEISVKWLEDVIWQGKPVCPHCGGYDSIKPYPSKKFTYQHNDCRKQFTVKTGGLMHSSKIPFQKWVIAIYYMLTGRKGISSLQLSKELSITQKSAWFMLQRIREACDTDGGLLSGIVEIDETYIGGKEANKHYGKKLNKGRGGVGKQAVLGMRERGGKVKAMPIPDTNMNTFHKEIGSFVEFGSTVYTDEHRSYGHLHNAYQHGSVCHSVKEYVNGMAHTNGIESVWAVLKRGYNGVYHNWSTKHCHRYVNEFAFRLNEGNCSVDTLDRVKSLCAATAGKRLTYKDLVS